MGEAKQLPQWFKPVPLDQVTITKPDDSTVFKCGEFIAKFESGGGQIQRAPNGNWTRLSMTAAEFLDVLAKADQ